MSKTLKLLLILIILVLAGCSPSQADLPPTATTAPLPQASDTPVPPPSATPEPLPTETAPAQEPAAPTADLGELLAGSPIPLLPAAPDVTVHAIHMATSQIGWGITREDPQGDHILYTADGGVTWQDVTPPQPLSTSGMPLTATAGFADGQTAFVNYNGSRLVWTTRDSGITWQPAALTYDTMGGGLWAVLDPDHAWLFQFLDAGMQKVYTALARTDDGGQTWEALLDPYSDSSIQSFDKTGAAFLDPQHGWLTRNFRGVAVYVALDVTLDGGVTWQELQLPAPPDAPDAFSTCACGLYDPHLESGAVGSVRMTCQCYTGDAPLTKNYLYRTADSGSTWDIQYVPEGQLYSISEQIRYLATRDIYRSTDGGVEWDLVKSVSWQGQFSFIDHNLAWAVAYNPDSGLYALVKTTDGCTTFQIIEPRLIPSTAQR